MRLYEEIGSVPDAAHVRLIDLAAESGLGLDELGFDPGAELNRARSVFRESGALGLLGRAEHAAQLSA